MFVASTGTALHVIADHHTTSAQTCGNSQPVGMSPPLDTDKAGHPVNSLIIHVSRLDIETTHGGIPAGFIVTLQNGHRFFESMPRQRLDAAESAHLRAALLAATPSLTSHEDRERTLKESLESPLPVFIKLSDDAIKILARRGFHAVTCAP